jgi:hypothetical protein
MDLDALFDALPTGEGITIPAEFDRGPVARPSARPARPQPSAVHAAHAACALLAHSPARRPGIGGCNYLRLQGLKAWHGSRSMSVRSHRLEDTVVRHLLILATVLAALAAPATAQAFGLAGSCGCLEVPLLPDSPLFEAAVCPVAYVGASAGVVAAAPVAAVVAPLPVGGHGSAADRFRYGIHVGRTTGTVVVTLPLILTIGSIADMATSL